MTKGHIKYTIVFLALSILSLTSLYAQENNRKAIKLTREGNKAYKAGDFETSEEKYKMALLESSDYFKARYNLANDLFKLKRYKEAAEAYESLTASAPTPEIKAHIYHNLGNCQLLEKDLEASIESYKKSLRINPKDQQTRYNLSYAMELLNKQQQEEKKDDKENKDNKDDKDKDKKDQENKDDKENKDKNKDQEKDKDKEDKKDEEQDQNKDKEKEDKPKPEEGDKPKKMSEKDMQRQLKAIAEKDKETKEKLDKKKVVISTSKVEKDW